MSAKIDQRRYREKEGKQYKKKGEKESIGRIDVSVCVCVCVKKFKAFFLSTVLQHKIDVILVLGNH